MGEHAPRFSPRPALGLAFAAQPGEMPDTGPITVIMQPLEPFVAEALDAVPADRLPDFRWDGVPGMVKRTIERELGRCGFAPEWLADWLATNVAFQGRLFAELSGARVLALRLETVADDACERFHIDNVRHRLLCTYRGPGTEWLDPKILASIDDDTTIPEAAVRRLERGAAAFMRGGLSASIDRPALVHRSPRIEGTGIVRLLLAIDEVV